MEKKVLFFDIDGTLLNSELKIPEGVKKELKRLKDAGFKYDVFVKETRVESNEVVLAPLSSLYRQEMWLGDWNLVENSRVLGANEVIVKIRYRKQANRCRVTLTVEGLLRVRLIEPLESIAPGQAAAFYDKDGYLLGGGIIL